MRTITKEYKLFRFIMYCPFCKCPDLWVHSNGTLRLKGIRCFMVFKHKKMRCVNCGRVHIDPRVYNQHLISRNYTDDFTDKALSFIEDGLSIRQAARKVKKELGHAVAVSTLHDWATRLDVDTSWARHRKGKD